MTASFSKRDSEFDISRLSFLLAHHSGEWNTASQSDGDGYAANDVDEEVCGNDGAEKHSAGDRRAIADADQAGQLDISGEAKTARTPRTPEPPTDAARRWHTTRHAFHSEIGARSVLRVADEVLAQRGFLNPVIVQCDKEMSIIDVCRKVARERNVRTVLRFAPKTSHQSNGFVEAVHGHIQGLARCYQTQIAANIDATFTNFTCHSIRDSLRWICALKIHSATRRQNAIPIFARNSVCVTFVHGIRVDPRSRSASSQADEQMDQW